MINKEVDLIKDLPLFLCKGECMKDLNLSQEIINKLQKAIEMSSNKIGPERIAAETGLRLNLVREFINYPERLLKDAVKLEQSENYDIDKNAFNSNDCDICMFNPYYDDDMRIEGEAEGMEV